MKPIKLLFLPLCMNFAVTVHAATPGTSLCLPDENVLFSCSLKRKIASVCATKDLSTSSGYVFYRFGSPGMTPELIYPDSRKKPAEAFFVFFSSYAKGSTAQLSFSVGETTYVVYSEHNAFDDNGSGIAVERAAKRIAHLKCASNVRHELFLLEKLGIPKTEFRTLP